MKFESHSILLKDGRDCILRSPERADAAAMLDCLRQIFGETPYLLRYPDEIQLTLEQEEAFIAAHADGDGCLLLAAFVDGTLAGCICLDPVSSASKCRHRAVIGISLKREFWGLGIAAGLMKALIEQARCMSYGQLELEVAAENRRAIALYEGFGFVQCGRIPKGMRLRDGRDLDLCLMALDLEN